MRASVCSTESWTWAAICARSSARARACRSAMRSRTRLSHHGPKMTTLAAMTSAAPPTGRRAATVVWPSTRSAIPAAPISTPATTRAMSQRRPRPWASPPNNGTTSLSMKAFSDSLALRQMSTTTPMAKKVGHPTRPMNGDVQAGRDELHRDEQWDQDGGDRPDASPIVGGARGDVGVLALNRDQDPGHGVDEDHHSAGDGQQDEPDAHPHGVDARGPRDGAADAAQDSVVRSPAQCPQPSPHMVVVLVLVVFRVGPWPVPVMRPVTVAGGPSRPGAGGSRARPATALSGGHRR